MQKILPRTRVITGSINEESSSDIEKQEEEEVASENGSEAEDTQESNNDTENDSEETESNSHETSTTFLSENPCEHCANSNVYVKCPNCSWHDSYKICPICDHLIPEERNNTKEGFLRCHNCGTVTHKNAKTLETTCCSRSKEENEEDD